jgi:uncharacterized protein
VTPRDIAPAPPSPSDSPCLTCGACCAAYRVSFYWAEAEERGLPESLTERISPWQSCLVGTNGPVSRCTCLQGVIGQSVSCAIYEQRPSPCRDLHFGDDQCHRARAKHRLPPLPQP